MLLCVGELLLQLSNYNPVLKLVSKYWQTITMHVHMYRLRKVCICVVMF